MTSNTSSSNLANVALLPHKRTKQRKTKKKGQSKQGQSATEQHPQFAWVAREEDDCTVCRKAETDLLEDHTGRTENLFHLFCPPLQTPGKKGWKVFAQLLLRSKSPICTQTPRDCMCGQDRAPCASQTRKI